jgi:hypothetical protein
MQCALKISLVMLSTMVIYIVYMSKEYLTVGSLPRFLPIENSLQDAHKRMFQLKMPVIGTTDSNLTFTNKTVNGRGAIKEYAHSASPLDGGNAANESEISLERGLANLKDWRLESIDCKVSRIRSVHIGCLRLSDRKTCKPIQSEPISKSKSAHG